MKQNKDHNLINLNGLASVRLATRSLMALAVYGGYHCLIVCAPRTLTP